VAGIESTVDFGDFMVENFRSKILSLAVGDLTILLAFLLNLECDFNYEGEQIVGFLEPS